MANRTIQFCGYAYGSVPVQLNAHINGQTVFSGAVDTLNEDIPALPVDMTTAPVLFSVTESALFPTSFSGSYPMTISVATGSGVLLCATNSNYMQATSDPVTFSGSISGTTLNVSSVTSGEISIGQTISNNVITAGTKIVSGNGSTWQVSASQITSEATINGLFLAPGTVDTFKKCFNGTPTNSDGTLDSRSSVQINGLTQDRPAPPDGEWTWEVTAGSTIEYNFNVSLGRA
jgi:hypothetical protein